MNFLTKHRIEKVAGNYTIIAVCIILLIKFIGWTNTDSLSLFTSLIDSSFDILISFLNLLAIKYAQKPSDEDHKFGHTAIEDIVGLAQTMFIFSSAIFIFFEGVSRFINPSELKNNVEGIWVMIISSVITLSIIGVQKFAVSKTKSNIIEADSVHYVSDFVTNFMIIFSLFFVGKSGYIFDIITAFLISGYMIRGAWKIGFRSFNNLMGKEADEKTINEIKSLIHLNSKIIGFHNLKTRFMGRKLIIQVDIDVSKNLSLVEAHDIADELQKLVESTIHDSEIIVHTDPHD